MLAGSGGPGREFGTRFRVRLDHHGIAPLQRRGIIDRRENESRVADAADSALISRDAAAAEEREPYHQFSRDQAKG